MTYKCEKCGYEFLFSVIVVGEKEGQEMKPYTVERRVCPNCESTKIIKIDEFSSIQKIIEKDHVILDEIRGKIPSKGN